MHLLNSNKPNQHVDNPKTFNKSPSDKLHLCLLQANDIITPNSNKVPNLEFFIHIIQPPHIPRDYLQIHWDTIKAISLLEPLALPDSES